MEAVPSSKPSISRERDRSDGYSTLPRTSHRETSGNSASSQSADENRSPANMPKGLSSMLKTTTETGDIGMFSIKRPRVPPSLATPRRIGGSYGDVGMQNGIHRPRQSIQPYGVPKVDDRRRLPSYSKDTTSENQSMYDTSSLRSSSRISEEPDYRSYSMTQTSYSAYPLANHRSYTSLRSQPDMNGLAQRPRSPFAYPSRLKRPGFRPSSPALTDGGAIDYRRRAEIERIPNGVGHNISSPSSLYADRRRPPLPLRSEGNRSTSSLLSQPSPPRRSSTPHTLRSNGPPGSDWYRKNGPATVNSSPARSAFNLASTNNIYINQYTPPSITTTPGKAQPTSPLYYDYTEDFDDDNYNHPNSLDSPPQFHIEQTIPEDEPIGVESLSTSGPQSTIGSSNDDLQKGASDTSASLSSPDEVQRDEEDLDIATQQTPRDDLERKSTTSSKQEGIGRDRKTIRLSGLGSGTQELSSHVEEALGLLSSESFGIPVSQLGAESDSVQELPGNTSSTQVQNEHRELSSGTSMHGLADSLPPMDSNSSSDQSLALSPVNDAEGRNNNNRTKTELSSHSTEHPLSPSFGKHPLQPSPVGSHVRSSGLYKVDMGLTELVDFIDNFEAPNELHIDESSTGLISLGRTPGISPMLLDDTLICKASSVHSITPSLSSFVSLRADGNQSNTLTQPSKTYQNHRSRNLPQASEFDLTRQVPNFSHQMTHKISPRSHSPMLAPKPISPARQLKLKNSIPQLMKALPPLPPEQSERAVSPPSDNSFSRCNVLRSLFSEFSSDIRATPVLETCEEVEHLPLMISAAVAAIEEALDKEKENSHSSLTGTLDQIMEDNISNTLQVLPRLKLKLRGPATFSPPPATDSKPWSLESPFPWSGMSSNVHQLSLTPEDAENSKPPKFKLKVSRATNSTFNSVVTAAQDTIRINRNSSESIELHLQNPKDLFTPNGVNYVFRKPSKPFHSRKESAANSVGEDQVISVAADVRTNQSSTTSLGIVEPATTNSPVVSSNFLSPPEARSVFSDDSSHVRRSLRKRLSNLKARIAAPYVSRNGTQSYDDITWRDRNEGEVPIPSTARSIPNLQSNRSSTEAKSLRRFTGMMHRQRLKAKLQEWLKGARAVFTSRGKAHDTNGGHDTNV